MFAVINTINAHKTHAGTVMSVHYTLAAAELSAAAIARRWKRDNGPSFYLPLRVVETRRRVWIDERVGPSDIVRNGGTP